MKPKEVVCMMALQFAWPVSVKFDHFFFYQTTYYTRTNKIKISQMIISSFSKWLPPRFVNKRKPFQYDLLALFSIKQKKCHPEIGLQFMITGILWKQSEFFYKIEHVVLFTAWNQQTQTLFKLRNIPSSVESFSLSFFKEVLKSLLHFSPVWHSTVCQANDFLLNQILKYLLLFAFSLLRWLHLYAKIFWNIFE